MQARTQKSLRFVLLLGLLLLELGLVIGVYFMPQFHAQRYAPPDGHWQLELPMANSTGMRLGMVGFVGLFALGNAGLILLVWRAYRNLKS